MWLRRENCPCVYSYHCHRWYEITIVASTRDERLTASCTCNHPIFPGFAPNTENALEDAGETTLWCVNKLTGGAAATHKEHTHTGNVCNKYVVIRTRAAVVQCEVITRFTGQMSSTGVISQHIGHVHHIRLWQNLL